MLVALPLIVGLTVAVATDAAPTVVPCLIYKNSLLIQAPDEVKGRQPHTILIRPLDVDGIVTTIRSPANPRSHFESLFVRGGILVFGVTHVDKFQLHEISTNRVHYLSADAITNAKWVHVDPSGEPVRNLAGEPPAVWGRVLPDPTRGYPGMDAVGIRHTAVAAKAERDLLIFDLVRRPHPPVESAVTRKIVVRQVTPDQHDRADGLTNVAHPKAQVIAEFAADFDEPFQAYVIKDDYYFVTRSGSAYVSLSPEKGKARCMAPLWDSAKPRIRFIISDSNAGDAHFVITDGKAGGWDFFLLGRGPRPQHLGSTGDSIKDRPTEIAYQLGKLLRNKTGKK